MKDKALQILKEKFGYDKFRPNQLEIIELVTSGNNCIALLPTGFGKSVLFILSSFLLKGITIVISPLISLMNDQKKKLDQNGINAIVLHSNLTEKEEKYAYKCLLSGETKLVYVSPERLTNKSFKNMISKINVSLIAVDEAHTILWGDSFRQSFLKISDFISELNKNVTILAVTATATKDTVNIISNVLKLDNYQVINSSVVRKNIIYRVLHIENKDAFLKEYLIKNQNEKIIIYCLTRKMVEYLYIKLKEYNCVIYHGGLDKQLKIDNQELFSNGKSKIIICTNAFGMGIDISDIRHVIHYEIPSSIEDLVQQAGRAARDGKMAYETVLFNFDDIKIVKAFISNLPNNIKKRELEKLNNIVDFCLSRKCRHQMIASYFGEKINKCRSFCDNCRKYE